jgi:putative FmdB family regulatory protein
MHEYKCGKCDYKSDVLVFKYSDVKDVMECPKCQGEFKRVLFAGKPALQFVGTGWPGQDMKLKDRVKSGDIASTKP